MKAESFPTTAGHSGLGLLIPLVALAIVYTLTATWGPEGQTRDTAGAALPGWSLAKSGSLDVSEFAEYDAWLVELDDGFYSNRSPGLIAVSFVGYLITSPFTTEFVFWPATLVAVLTSVFAAGFVAAAARKMAGVPAYLTIALFGLATSMWSIASDQLWPHGPAAMFIALSVWLLASDRQWWTGASLGAAILIRPPVAVIAAVAGLGLALSRRSVEPAIRIGVPSALGAGVYLAYNRVLFGSWSPMAVYDAVAGGLGDPTQAVASRVDNILVALFSPRHGVLIWTPWIIVGLFALRRVWNRLSDWAKPLPIAGVLYVIVHVQLNRVSGGLPYNYRYALEAVALTAPVLVAGLFGVRRDRVLKYASIVTVVVALSLQFAYMFVAECTGIGTSNPKCALFGL
jgi:hypothetical protein